VPARADTVAAAPPVPGTSNDDGFGEFPGFSKKSWPGVGSAHLHGQEAARRGPQANCNSSAHSLCTMHKANGMESGWRVRSKALLDVSSHGIDAAEYELALFLALETERESRQWK